MATQPTLPPFSVAVLATFPELVDEALRHGITGRAREAGLWRWAGFPLKQFAHDARRTIDARPAGGGPGMVLLPGPLDAALAAATAWHGEGASPLPPRVVMLSLDGAPLRQALVRDWTQSRRPLTLVAGRYEGIDQRWIEAHVDAVVSLGDFVLSGGELPAAVLIDACVRLLPGALGDEASAESESFVSHRLDWPYYALGAEATTGALPEVLRRGDHAQIGQWRQRQSLLRTLTRRPELLARERLTLAERALLTQLALECAAFPAPRPDRPTEA